MLLLLIKKLKYSCDTFEKGLSIFENEIIEKFKKRPFRIPCQLRRLYHKFKASSNLPSKKIAS